MVIEIGGTAPDFVLRDNHGRTVRLSDSRRAPGDATDAGRDAADATAEEGPERNARNARNIVLVFYPFAFTSVCTDELRALNDELPAFVNDDTLLLAVSNDSVPTLRVFAEQEGLEFPLLSDFWPHGEVSRTYGVFDEEKGCAVRGTFIIDKEGVVRWTVVNGLPDARDLTEYLKALGTL